MRQAAAHSTAAGTSRTSWVRSAAASGMIQDSRTSQNRSPNSTYATTGSNAENSGTNSAASSYAPAAAKRSRACGYTSKQHATTMAHRSAATCAPENAANGKSSKNSSTRI